MLSSGEFWVGVSCRQEKVPSNTLWRQLQHFGGLLCSQKFISCCWFNIWIMLSKVSPFLTVWKLWITLVNKEKLTLMFRDCEKELEVFTFIGTTYESLYKSIHTKTKQESACRGLLWRTLQVSFISITMMWRSTSRSACSDPILQSYRRFALKSHFVTCFVPTMFQGKRCKGVACLDHICFFSWGKLVWFSYVCLRRSAI